jgi:SulP family sulfate permease
MATLAAILVVVAYHMSEWRTFLSGLRSPRSDVVVLLTTFLLTVLIDLTVAIEVGIVLAALLFMRRMAEVTRVSPLSDITGESRAVDEPFARQPAPRSAIPPGVQVYDINGPFFFGAAEKFKDTLATVSGTPRVLIIRMRDVPAIDATGMHALLDVLRRSRRDGTLVLLSDVHAQPLVALTKSGAVGEIGEENVCATLEHALERARRVLGPPA